MKVFRRIDGSICGAIPILLSRHTVSPLILPPFAHILSHYRRNRVYSQDNAAAITSQQSSVSAPDEIPGHAPLRTFYATRAEPARPVPIPNGFWNSSEGENAETVLSLPAPENPDIPLVTRPAQPVESKYSKEELLALVDQYDEDTVEEHLRPIWDPYMRGYARADGPSLQISNRQEEMDFPSYDQVMQTASENEQRILHGLRYEIVKGLVNPGQADADAVYELYHQLPEPRMSHVYAKLRHGILKVLGRVPKKDTRTMLRFFAVVADVKNSGFTLTRIEWNTAISFASRYVGRSGEGETESALQLWREMEQEAGIRGNDVTFNILFDVASKSGNFSLAEMIYQEMENRGHIYNRYHHVSLIHFFGLKLDGNGVRAAYKEMVNAGEIVDTVVLNAVISGLLRSGEDDAAERIYARMKASSARSDEMPDRNYATNKMITRVLMMFAKVGRKNPVLRPAFQSVALLTPDLQTYRILINHYGVQLGDLSKVAQFLDDMKFFQLPLHGSIFLALFKGFALHGGVRDSPWSEQRLNSIISAFFRAFDSSAEGLQIEKWLAFWALKATHRCTDMKRVSQMYAELEARWNLDESDLQFVIDGLHRAMKGR